MGQARESAGHLLSWLESGRDEAAVFTFDTRLDEVAAFTTDLAALPARLDAVRPFGATSLHDAIAQAAERVSTRVGRRRAVIVFTDGNDNFSRLNAGRGLGHRQRDRCAGVHHRPRLDGRRSIGRRRRGLRRAIAARRSIERPDGMDGRPDVRCQRAGSAKRGRAADCGRAPPSVPDGIRIERQAGLASARGPSPWQGSHRTGPERLYRGAISPDFAVGG